MDTFNLFEDAEEQTTLDTLAEQIRQLKGKSEQKPREVERTIVVVPQEKKVDIFRGTGTPTLEQFEGQLEDLWTSQNTIKEADRVASLLQHLADSVKDELDCYPPIQRDSVRDIRSILRNVFGQKRPFGQLFTCFCSTRQLDGEGVREFSHKANRAFKEVQAKARKDGVQQLPDRTLRDHFVDNLQNALLRKRLRETTHQRPTTTFLRVRDEAIRWTGEDAEEPSVRVAPCRQVEAEATQGKLLAMMEQLTSQLAGINLRLTQLEETQRQRQPPQQQQNQQQGSRFPFTADGRPICFKCQGEGHMARNCPGKGGPRQ